VQAEERQHQQATDPIPAKVTVWRYASFAPERKLLIGTVTLATEMIWNHGWLHSFCTAGCLTHLSVAEIGTRRRDRCSQFLESNVVEQREQMAQ
jgi:hypothetical protein